MSSQQQLADGTAVVTGAAGSMAGMVDAMLERAAVARLGQPKEIASVAAFLCSPAARLIAGTDMLVDGGAGGQVAGLGFWA
jgi:NAD(P)-dependent dehydrogenase (short-subunit alcohol dehydrogenase family)